MPGINHQVVDPPRPVTNPQLADVTHQILALVSGVLGIPPQLLATEQVVHAANAEMDLRMFDKTIKALQKDLEPILQDLFEASYRDSHREFRRTAYEEIKRVRKEDRDRETVEKALENDEDADDEPSEEHVATPVKKFIPSTGEPSQSGHETKEPSMSDKIKVSKAVGQSVTKPKRPAEYRISPISLDGKKVRDLIKQNIQFKISFKRTPLTDLASLEAAWRSYNIIGYEDFAASAAEVIGLEASSVLDKHEHEKQIEEERRHEAQMLEKYGPPPDEKAKTGAPSAAKNKASPKVVASDLKKVGSKH